MPRRLEEFTRDNLKLLKCFTCTRNKCHYICTVSDANIEAIGKLVKAFLQKKLKLPNLRKITKTLFPIRLLLRILADRKTNTRYKRKILLNFAIKLILYPIIEKKFIPYYSHIVKRSLKKTKTKK